jgi:xylose isomerase
MRTYLIYKEKAKRWNEDKEIQGLVRELSNVKTDGLPTVGAYSKATVDALRGYAFDRKALGARGLGYEKLDQLTLEVLLGVR